MADHDITALVLRESRAEWTRLESRKGRFEKTGHEAVDLARPEGAEDWSDPEALAVLKPALAIDARDRLGISIGTDQALLRVADLPSVDREELLGMAELQVDKIAPFPSDQMYMGIEVLSATDDTSRVLIGAAPQSRVDRVGHVLNGLGFQPVRADVDVLGWWRLLKDGGHVRENGAEIILVLDGTGIEFVFVSDGQPLLLRALDASLDPAREADAPDLVDEIEYTLTTLEGQWGRIDGGSVQIWHAGRALEAFRSALAARGFSVELHDLDGLPPLSEGIARRMADGEHAALDLAPASWKLQRQAKGLQKIAIKAGAIVLGVWAVLMAAVLLLAGGQRGALARTQGNFDRLRQEVDEVRALQSQVEALEAYGDRSFSGLECLREVSELLPPGVDLTSFSYTKFGELGLRGEAAAADPIVTFIDRLEQSEMFVEVRTEGVTSQMRNNQARSLFRVTAILPGGEDEDAEGGS